MKRALLTVLLSMFMAAATQSMGAQTTGKIVVNFNITIDANISPTANISCQAIADVSDGSTTPKVPFHESATVLATRTGSTATCTVDLPYSWNLTTPATDKIVLGYVVAAPAEAATVSAVLPARASSQPRFAVFTVPASGTTTTENATVTF